ncbi:mannosyltransferase [Neodidymelliopsis sp. IMI 364377]|nr:mannosyltransferase [Neodidymelliopsis sp. IMI 364377]
MRLSIRIVALATLFASTLAAPTVKQDSVEDTPKEADNGIVRRDGDDGKYFHEPGGDMTLGHYDKRYFHGVVSDEERRDTQKHMVRAYLDFFRANDLDTWIAHGTLLGWWWNGQRLPWDFDLDTQVSGATLHHMGEAYNQTRYSYTSSDEQVQRTYLLDVNPWIWERVRGNGANVIDARWIDIRNGLFIDITGLSEIEPDKQPGIWSCKNYHRYRTDELYPMRETMFEGVMAKVPYSYDKILTDEYKESALVNTQFNGHEWNPNAKIWEKTEDTLKHEEEERKKKEEEKQKAVEQAQVA